MNSTEHPIAQTGVVIDGAVRQAMPVPDLLFGGGVLVLVILCHAFWMRRITNSFLTRMQLLQTHDLLWRAEVVFALTVAALLAVHLTEIFLWTIALVFGGIVTDWAQSGYFAANCYVALGEPFSLPHAWRMLPPIIAISGIFTFAWTGSVLVNFVSRLNDLRADLVAKRHRHTANR
jgi:hypothetical protein